MSESDDTDVLLSIPPDLYTVVSSLNVSSESLLNHQFGAENVNISNLISQIQSLDDRISIIESKENSLDFINLSLDQLNPKFVQPLEICDDPKLLKSRVFDKVLMSANFSTFSGEKSNEDEFSDDRNFFNGKNNQHLMSTPKKKQVNCWVDTKNEENGAIVDEDAKEKEKAKTVDEVLELWDKQKLMSLSDFWTPGPRKSEEEMLRIKLEEEKLRRKHCEELIQDLQKRILEEQEKVGVALRVDKEKNAAISQFQSTWIKFKERFSQLESSNNLLKLELESQKQKYELDLSSKDSKISSLISEKEKLDEKCDQLSKEKLNLISNGANEIEKYKKLIETTENRYEKLKKDHEDLVKKHQQLEQSMARVMEDLQKNQEVRDELLVIHKALETCEAELIVLREEKENLMLKLKEEGTRVGILEKAKSELFGEVEKMRKNEMLHKDEILSLISQHEVQKTELRNIYQSQVDEAVNTKLKEFQNQLDAAESNFQLEMENKQRAIAECAAKKIKKIIDKHQLEVNLLEEKHKEEKCLYEIRLSQMSKKTSAYEAQLSAQQNAKSRLAEQLHSLMEKQYQQALKIITKDSYNLHPDSNKKQSSEGNYLPKIGIDISPSKRRNSEYPEVDQDHEESFNVTDNETTINKTPNSSTNDLKKYIKMILQMNQNQNFPFLDCTTDQQNHIFREVPRKNYTKVDEKLEGNELKNTVDFPTEFSCDKKTEKFKPPWK